jgi:hypothetical protein
MVRAAPTRGDDTRGALRVDAAPERARCSGKVDERLNLHCSSRDAAYGLSFFSA